MYHEAVVSLLQERNDSHLLMFYLDKLAFQPNTLLLYNIT